MMEGFMDFLSVLSFDSGEIKQLSTNSDFLVLNSLGLLKHSLPILRSHCEINLFLDNDIAAKEARETLKEKGIRFTDASSIYDKHKDVNEYLINEKRDKQCQVNTMRRSKGIRR